MTWCSQNSRLRTHRVCRMCQRIDFATVLNAFCLEDADSNGFSTAVPISMCDLKTSLLSVRLAVFRIYISVSSGTRE